jgi:rare lipoprotein A
MRLSFLIVFFFCSIGLADCELFQKGTASYYGSGPGWAGRLTASGESFNPSALTAAHRSLPFGTRVLVKNLKTNKSVFVRINDHGPYISGRIIDLSVGAAQKIGLTGIGPVEIRLCREE